ncbi:MAG: flagellar brake protein [Methylacidiphilales bacterium]|nr:flagellar brake protein [Candidatus Methylacidiphilales bacterium]
MNQPQDPPQSPSLSAEDDFDKYSINWKKEIVFLLRAIMDKGGLLSAHFDHGKNFILTSIIDVDADRGEVILDFGATEALNLRILESDKIIFVTSHDKVKVQFVANRIEKTRFEGRDAFRIKLPESVIKLQRREFFRVTTPIANPLKCIVPIEDGSKIEMTIVDISIGGIGVILPQCNIAFTRGMAFPDCHLALPGIGNIVATLEIRSVFDVTLRNGQPSKRAGCQLVDLPANMQAMIQRYIIKVERERRSKDLDRQ